MDTDLQTRMEALRQFSTDALHGAVGLPTKGKAKWGQTFDCTCGITGAFFYGRLNADFDADGKHISYVGDGGGVGVAGGSFRGKIVLYGDLSDLTNGSCLFTVHFMELSHRLPAGPLQRETK